MNRAKFISNEKRLKKIMNYLSIPMDEHSKDTPSRILRMWEEMFSSLSVDTQKFKESLTVFPAPDDSDSIIMNDIPFHSMCAHHWLPFFGKCRIEYIPNKYIIGLSKIPRVINFCAKKPQVQENLTSDIGNMLVEVLQPVELKVKLYNVVHTCVSCRGIESYAETETNWKYSTSI